MKEPVKISALIITLNGERLLDKCLDSVAFCDHILIVDSFSSDTTQDIAKAHGATFIQNPWPGNAKQIQFGLKWLEQNAPSEWVLFLDCDEVCSAPLINSIKQALNDTTGCVGYSMPRRTWYFDRFLKYGGSYPDRLFRLFRPESMQINESGAHQSFSPKGKSGALQGDLLHYTYASFANQMEKLNDYAQRGAKDMRTRGRKGGIALALGHGLWRFVQMYGLKRGFLDGKAGFLMASHTAFYTFLKYIRIEEGSWGAPYHHE